MKGLLISLLLLALLPRVSARLWTDTRGRAVEARLASSRDGQAKLVKADGQVITIALEHLSQEDRAFISKTQASPQDAPPGLGKVRLLEKETREGEQVKQDLLIDLKGHAAKEKTYTLNVAYVAGAPDGRVKFFGLSAQATQAGYSQGSSFENLDADEFNRGSYTFTINRVPDTAFIGYHVSLVDGARVIDTHHWEQKKLLEKVRTQLKKPRGWWQQTD